MIKLIPCIGGLVVFACSFVAQAQDDLAARQAAADRYLQLLPIAPVVEDSIAMLAMRLPPSQQRSFVGKMQVLVDRKAVALVAREALVKTFTLDELLALNAFYQTKHGAAIAGKMPAYNAAFAPAVTEVLLKGISRYDEAMQGRR
jgi:hypothetical protein